MSCQPQYISSISYTVAFIPSEIISDMSYRAWESTEAGGGGGGGAAAAAAQRRSRGGLICAYGWTLPHLTLVHHVGIYSLLDALALRNGLADCRRP